MAEEKAQEAQAEAKAAEGDLLSQTLGALDLSAPEGSYDVEGAVVTEKEQEKLPTEIAIFTQWALQGQPTFQHSVGDACQAMIDQIDETISDQVAAVLHHPDFQRLESSWRSLKFLVDRTNFREGKIKLDVLNVSKGDLVEDFRDVPELSQSGLFNHVYKNEYDMFGGEPYGAMVANYEFGRGSQDIALLQNCAGVAAASHCPFVSGVGKQFFGFDDVNDFYKCPDIKAIFEMDEYRKWNKFRDSEDSRYVGLAAPRFLLRLPYGNSEFEENVEDFNFSEKLRGEMHDKYLWGNAAFALASCMTRSFDKWGWCTNIVGPQSGGAVEDLPVHLYKEAGEMIDKCPTEVPIPDANELALSESGIIPLIFRKNSDNASFFGAQSTQKAKKYDKPEATASARLTAKLFNMMLHARFSHYLKVI